MSTKGDNTIKALGRNKYYMLCREYSLKDLKALDSDTESVDKIKATKSALQSYGLNVTVGG
ncbi:hypothetical protein ES703_28217 [subsurface metagenome]